MKIKTKLFSALIMLLSLSTSQTVVGQSSKKLSTNGQVFEHLERKKHHDSPNNSVCPNMEYRTIDGTCNNTTRMERIVWGASDIALYRSMTPQYGTDDHYNDMNGSDRLSARAISNYMCAESEATPDSRRLSSFVFTWGQFVDHDISLTPEGHTEYEPIILPDDEPLFVSDMAFFRSEIYEDSGDGNYRQQSNLITSYIDGSNVYGSDETRADWLRTFVDGKLKVSEGNLLPFNTVDGEYDSAIDENAPSMAGDGGGTVKTFVAGDIRAAEQPGLTSLHTLFVRLHNSICNKMKNQGLNNEQQIYQKARKEVGAIIQSITYNEFLPSLGLELRPYRKYNSNVRADISNLFATAAYRLGHTMVTDELLLKNDNCSDFEDGSVSLLAGFFNPQILRTNNIAPILNGLSIQVQNEVDTKIIDNLRNFLFGDPSSPNAVGLDLASLNIQRGRDHGLPDYNTVRRQYIGHRASGFNDISKDPEVRHALKESYSDVDNIDLWVGLLAEDKVQGTSLGKTLQAIMKRQFENLRDGDRYYFQNDKFLNHNDKNRIENTRLSDVIRQNTNINSIQRNVFVARACASPKNNLTPEIRSTIDVSSDFVIAPNPGLDFIEVITEEELSDDARLFIYNISGQLLKQEALSSSRSRIDIGSLPPGTYVVTMLSSGIRTSKRFIKIK